MNQLKEGTYDVDITNKKFVHRATDTDYGKLIKDWSQLIEDEGFKSDYDGIAINIIMVSDTEILISRSPIISYANIKKHNINDIFDLGCSINN